MKSEKFMRRVRLVSDGTAATEYDENRMPGKTYEYQHRADDQLPDISQLVTSHLRPLQPRAQTDTQHVAQLRTEIRRLSELADAVEQAITALIIRQHMLSDATKREALEHNRADLQRFKDELVFMQVEHQRVIERLR